MSRIPRAWLIVSIFLLVIPLFSSVSFADENTIQLVWNVTNNPSSSSDSPYGVAEYGDYIYVCGSDYIPGNSEFRIEKIQKSDGTIVDTFTENPNSDTQYFKECIIVNDYLYVVGVYYVSSSNAEIYICKFDLDLNKISCYGSNPSSAYDDGYDITTDGTYLYVAGIETPSSQGWRVEKYDLDLNLIDSYTHDISSSTDEARGITTDGTYIYVVGTDRSQGSGNVQWRIEKLDKNLNLISSATYNPSSDNDCAYKIIYYNGYLYVIGNYYNGSETNFKIRKYDTNLNFIKEWSSNITGSENALQIGARDGIILVTEYFNVGNWNSRIFAFDEELNLLDDDILETTSYNELPFDSDIPIDDNGYAYFSARYDENNEGHWKIYKVLLSINNAPQINITSPSNQTYYTTQLNLNFSVTDDSSTTFHVKAWLNDTLLYDNSSYNNGTAVSIDLSSYVSPFESYYVKVWANDTDSSGPKTTEENITFNIEPKINITSPTGYYVTLFNNLSIPINFTAGVEGYSGTFNALVYADGSLIENITNYANNDERSIDYTWDPLVHDHNVTIKLISGSNEWEETSEFTIQYGNIISHVYDEQSVQLVRKPILLTMTDGINEYKFGWGETFDTYNNSGMDNFYNLQYICDMDTDTYGHVEAGSISDEIDVYCNVAIKPGEVNNMKIKLNTSRVYTTIYAYNTQTDKWESVYFIDETGILQTKTFTINNTESKYDGRIKINLKSSSDTGDRFGNIYEIYNEDGVSYLNVTDVHITNDIVTLIYDDGDSNDDYYRRVYHYNISELEDYTFNAYMLGLTKGITYTFYVKDFIGSPIANAFVSIEKFINGDYRPVEIGLTDTAGKVTMWVDPLVTYQLLVYASGYGNLTATFEPDISTRVSEIHLTGNVEELDIDQYNPVYGIEITRTEGIFQEAGTMVYVNVTETSSNMVSSYIKVTETGFNYSNTTYTDTCSNSHFCEFYFNLSKPSKRYNVELYVTRYENGTEVTREFNFEYITRGSGWLDINIDETGRSLWMFIWLILTLAILSVSYRFLGVASLSLIFVMTALGYFLGIYTLGEVILISIVLLIVLKMVI